MENNPLNPTIGTKSTKYVPTMVQCCPEEHDHDHEGEDHPPFDPIFYPKLEQTCIDPKKPLSNDRQSLSLDLAIWSTLNNGLEKYFESKFTLDDGGDEFELQALNEELTEIEKFENIKEAIGASLYNLMNTYLAKFNMFVASKNAFSTKSSDISDHKMQHFINENPFIGPFYATESQNSEKSGFICQVHSPTIPESEDEEIEKQPITPQGIFIFWTENELKLEIRDGYVTSGYNLVVTKDTLLEQELTDGEAKVFHRLKLQNSNLPERSIENALVSEFF